MRFFSHIFHHCYAGGTNGRQHNIHRGTHRNLIKKNLISDKPLGVHIQHAVLDLDPGTQRLKATLMLVNRPNAEIAPAGHGDPRMSVPAQHTAPKIIGSPHITGQLMRNSGRI